MHALRGFALSDGQREVAKAVIQTMVVELAHAIEEVRQDALIAAVQR